MKTKLYFVSLKNLFKDQIVNGGMVSLGNSFELPALFKRLGWRLVYTCFPKITKLQPRLSQLNMMCGYLRQMVKHHGASYAVAYLKACQLAVQKCVAKDRIKSLRDLVPDLPLPRLTTSGLPRIIPLKDRRAICNGSASVTRWWLTIFSVYRVISIPGKLKLSTITDPFTGDVKKLERVDYGMSCIATAFKSRFPKLSGFPSGVLQLETASPSNKVSWLGIISDGKAIANAGLLKSIQVILRQNFALMELKLLEKVQNISVTLVEEDDPEAMPWWKRDALGQLSTKLEAAGKIRVFALVDIWTQSALKPLHLALFDFLHSLPNDGTFNQEASVKRAYEKAKSSGKSYGYDLSAATDRLPAILQRTVLSTIYGSEFGSAWYDLLINRDYDLYYSKEEQSRNNLPEKETFRYAVGQPMGALSSWAMLAVTHHFIVQYAAILANKISLGQWYENYELLGDDIILFDTEVAEQYLAIMAWIGVPINTSKSVVASNDTIEFAKNTISGGENISAISWKMYISQNTMMGRASIAYSLIRKGIIRNKVVRWVENILRHTRKEKGALNYSLFALMNMFVSSRLLSFEELMSGAIPQMRQAQDAIYKNLLNRIQIGSLRSLLVECTRPDSKVEAEKKFGVTWMVFSNLFEQILRSKVKNFVDTFDLERESFKLAQKMAHLMMPKLAGKAPLNNLNYMNWSNVPTNDSANWIMNYLFKSIRSDLKERVQALNDMVYVSMPSSPFDFASFNVEPPVRPTKNQMMALVERPITDWIEAVDDIDRVNETLSLPSRLAKKLQGEQPKPKIDGPLANLKFLSRAMKLGDRLTVTGAVKSNRKVKRSLKRKGSLSFKPKKTLA